MASTSMDVNNNQENADCSDNNGGQQKINVVMVGCGDEWSGGEEEG